ncbi:FAD-binding protein [Pseudochelatococcus sp. B33]
MTLKRKDLRSTGPLHLDADVLVIGGGPAAAWAAIAAAQAGASVVLADKGYLGTSGATAPSNTGTWCVPPDAHRQAAVERRWRRTEGLGDQRWMVRCVDRAYENLLKLAEWGYPFPANDGGGLYLANLRGPDYMQFMRRKVLLSRVTVLDHHPALELLSDGAAVTGAAGVDRQRLRDWQVNARAVVLATGGCAFYERILGGTGLTGDAYLMAAEAGACLSGMEFTGKYTLAPFGTSLNKGLPYRWASFYREDGTPLTDEDSAPLRNAGGRNHERIIARAMIDGPVHARLDLAEPAVQDWMRRGQPNCVLPYDRTGVNPFRDLFRVTLKAEGTVRGTGGIHLATEDCGTGVPGLYAAGDAASRERVAGAQSGGGAVNASWAIASGWWAGAGAAACARRSAASAAFRQTSKPLGRAGLRPAAHVRADLTPRDVVEAVREEVVPLEKNYFRRAETLLAGAQRLDSLWSDIRGHLLLEGVERLRSREAAAVAATARWSLKAALLRTETRGLHRRTDHPQSSDAFLHSIILSGVDEIRADTVADAFLGVAS